MSDFSAPAEVDEEVKVAAKTLMELRNAVEVVDAKPSWYAWCTGWWSARKKLFTKAPAVPSD